MQISDENKFILSAIAVVALLTAFCLIFGAVFGFCDDRKINKQAANVQSAETTVEQSAKEVEQTKQDAAEVRGEVKILKEVVKENNEEVKTKTNERIKAAANRARIRNNPIRNVNGADLNRILNDADGKP